MVERMKEIKSKYYAKPAVDHDIVVVVEVDSLLLSIMLPIWRNGGDD